jgi:hypothetical protein
MSAIEKNFDKNKYVVFKTRMNIYNFDLAEWEKKNKTLSDIINFINVTIATHYVTYIRSKSHNLCNVLKTLKSHLFLHDASRKIEIQIKLLKLSIELNKQDLEIFLQEWSTTYQNAVTYDLITITNKRAHRDFLKSI